MPSESNGSPTKPDGTKTLLRSRRVLLPQGERAADVVIAGARIVAIEPWGRATAQGVDDLGELVLMPAAIDTHVHVNEPGRTEWEGFESATRAAAAGGLQLLVDMPLNSTPVSTCVEALDEKRRAARSQCHTDVALYAGLVPENAHDAAELTRLAHAGIAGFKTFLCDSGLDEFGPTKREDLEAAMPVLARAGTRLLAHAEILDRAESAAWTDPKSYAEYLASRPPTCEVRAVEMLCELAERTRCAVHIVHLASTEPLGILTAARARGVDVTVETCPHYLHFAAEHIPNADPRFKCAPPIRHAHQRDGLWSALEARQIDFVASDHSPCLPEMKQTSGDLAQAWGGIASLQLLLPVLWTGARARGHHPTDIRRWLVETPARWLGLPETRFELRVGADASLVAWDPDAQFEVSGEQLEHRHDITPYEGATLSGVVRRTWLHGDLIFADGKIVGNCTGRVLDFEYLDSGPTP